jgi:pilus assembly protein CpaE
MAASLKPHIVLMDINMPDMDGITATGEMSTKAPYSQVIIMSVQSDQHYMKRAMAAGARDFQPKPFTSEELVSCIRRVYNIGLPVYQQLEALEQAKAQPAKPAKRQQQTDGAATDGNAVIAVYSPKGGAGTSALVSNLAVAFQQQLGDTVLVDGALQAGDISVHLNTRPQRSIADTVHEGLLEVDLLDDVLMAHHSGLKLLLSPPQPELAESFNGKMVASAIDALRMHHNIVLVDTTPQLTDITLAVLEKASYILVVTTPELPAIKSVKLFLELAEQLDFDMTRLFVVINRADLPGGIPPNQIEKVLQLKHTFRIPNDTKLHFALNRGASVCLTEPAAASSTAIVSLAKDLRQRIFNSKAELMDAV